MHGIENFQQLSQNSLETAVKSLDGISKTIQDIATELTDYTKRAFENHSNVFEKVLSSKSLDQAFEIQSEYAKKSYDEYVAQMSKFGEMYLGLAKEFYKPVEDVFSRKS